MKIIFMGTPHFAVPSLDILVKNGYEIVAVVTATDKMGGRHGLLKSAVKQYAEANNIHVLQPEKLKNAEFLAELRSLEADLQIVVAFRMLPEVVWNMPKFGTMNLHGSLLPKYRGAAPINWAIINGDAETGCTTFLLQHEIDTGDLLFQAKMPIALDENAGSVHDRMMQMGAELVLKSVKAIENNQYSPQPQSDEIATHAPKIFTETCEIKSHLTCQQTHNLVRGLSPSPAAWTKFDNLLLKIYKTTPPQYNSDISPFEDKKWIEKDNFRSDGRNFFQIRCSDGWLSVEELQLEGKKRMNVKDFLNGYRF
ncbi:MAG: hypothetical protein RL757_2009 [Bacteroidota bacterium]|jgi:methionyl-tRNA formyltransferase